MQQRNHKSIQNVHHWQIRITSAISMIYLLIFLAGCAIWTADPKPRPVKQVEIVTQEIQKTPLNLPHPPPAEMEKVQWRIITPHNAEEVFKEMQNKGRDPVIFGLTEKNYKSLSTNFAQTRGYIIEQRKVLDQYKEYYETPIDNVTKK